MNKTEYESVQETAERLGVTVRAVQKWAAGGRIPGAEKIGRTWFIPKGAAVTDTAQANKMQEAEETEPNGIPDVYQLDPFRVAMPLLNSAYPIGKCMDFINAMSDEDDRNIALGEYYFFSGKSEAAAVTCEPYLDSHDPALRFSASLICTFANLARGHIHLARFAMGNLYQQVKTGLASDAPSELHAIGIFTATAASVLLHIPIPPVPPLENYLRYLPEGLRLFSSYVLAHKAYLENNYERSLAIADMALSMCEKIYPIACVYLNIVSVMALMSLKRSEEAKERFITAWETAKPDDLIQPFGEHHGLLQGMIEVYFKKNYPKDFERIIAVTYAFSSGWRKIHNPDTNHDVADNLTTTEFTVAMLYNRGWSALEIAGHMELSEHTVRSYIKTIYTKLGISSRSELGQYMLK